MNILGIGGSTHDYSFCIVKNGIVKVAIEEERLSKERNSDGPKSQIFQGLDYCLNTLCLKETDLNLSVTTDLFTKKTLPDRSIWHHTIKINHHLAHAASAYYTSGFNEAALLVVDGGGSHFGINQCELVSFGMARSNVILFHEQHYGYVNSENYVMQSKQIIFAQDDIYLNSDGVAAFYSLMTVACGFYGNQEGKLMGLAPYGTNKYVQALRNFTQISNKGEFHVSLNGDIHQFICNIYDTRKSNLFQAKADLAYATQVILEEYMYILLGNLYRKTKCKNLCFSGGVAMNSVLNGKLKKQSPFEKIHVFPAANDAGTAVGAALYGYYNIYKNSWQPNEIKSVFLGKTYLDKEMEKAVEKYSHILNVYKMNAEEIYTITAKLLADGKTVGWFQDGAEFGPRALGNRSILADCRVSEMRDILNSKVKFRESFRPFAPLVLEDKVSEYFETDFKNNPFMLFVGQVKKDVRNKIPAVTHIDNSARIQTVSSENIKIYRLIQEFFKITGVPVIINTSFNIKGKPMVETPADAVHCLLNSELDYAVLKNILICKKDI